MLTFVRHSWETAKELIAAFAGAECESGGWYLDTLVADRVLTRSCAADAADKLIETR